MFTRMAELDTVTDVDVLFLGSSHAFRGFDPRIFRKNGISSFNLGSASQTPIQTQYLLEEYLGQLRPKLVIYEVYPATLENDGVEASLDFIANSSLQLSGLKMAMEVNHIKTFNTLIYDTFLEVFHQNEEFQESEKMHDLYVSGGYVQTSIDHNISPITENIKANWKDQWEIRDDQWDAFLSNLNSIEQNNIPYILVQMPVTSEAYRLYKNNEQIDDLFRDEGQYINFNNSPFLNDSSDFMDYHHLNQNGVEKTNKKLILYLRKEYPTIFNPPIDE